MFGVGGGEVLVLIVIGVLLFGPDKLPELARKTARVVRYLRNIANNAQTTIRSELGPGYEDFDIRDPKAFLRKHLLEEVDPIVADVRRELDESTAQMRQVTQQLRHEADLHTGVRPAGPGRAAGPGALAAGTMAGGPVAGGITGSVAGELTSAGTDARRAPFDLEAT